MGSNWTIEYSPHVVNQFNSLGDSIVRPVLKRTDRLKENPRLGKPLKGKASGYNLRSLRIGTAQGEFRLIYQLWQDDQEILVVFIGSREDIYDRLERWLE
jgi:mRNA-degrading endonuclease RelE of RelBE toxin-antitoxin system